MPIWGYLFRVEADITVNGKPTEEWTSVFHLTIDGDNSNYGDRIPAVFINKDGYFHITSAVNGNRNHHKDFYFDYGRKCHLVIQQVVEDDKILYKIEVNGELIESIENENAQTFRDVKIYFSDPWFNIFTSDIGLLENIKFYDLSSE